MQGTQVLSLVLEDLTCLRAAEPVCHGCWARTLEPELCNQRSHCNKKAAHHTREQTPLTTREKPVPAMKTLQPNKQRIFFLKLWITTLYTSNLYNSIHQLHFNSGEKTKLLLLAQRQSFHPALISSLFLKDQWFHLFLLLAAFCQYLNMLQSSPFSKKNNKQSSLQSTPRLSSRKLSLLVSC